MGLTYGDLFEDWEIAIAKKTISHFQASYPWLKGLDFDDLLQECLIHWCLNRAKYQPDRGASARTFMARVLSTRLQMILREQLTDRRKSFWLAESLEKSLDEEGITLLDTLDADDYIRDLTLRVDIEFVLRTLNLHQREICDLLEQDYPVKKIAEMLGKPRSTIRDEIKRIRDIFSRKGLKDYIK